MDQNSPRTIRNMYKYVAERMKGRLNKISLVQEISDEMRKLIADIDEDFKIIRKIEKKINKRCGV